MKKLKRIVLSTLVSLFIANMIFIILEMNGHDKLLHNIFGYVATYTLIYALIPAIILSVLFFKVGNKAFLFVLIPLLWSLLIIVFFAYANDILKYGLNLSKYQLKPWLFTFDRMMIVIVPALFQGFIFWFASRSRFGFTKQFRTG